MQDTKGKIVYDFNKYKNNQITAFEIDEYLVFMKETGLEDLIQNHIINNLVDYAFGVEVGLDSNGRKNRGGHLMEDLLEKYELDEVEEEPTVYFAGSDLLTCATDDMYQGEILSYAQADNAIDAEGSSWVNIDIETLLAANPDYVFIEAGSLSADDFKNDARVQELQAVQNDHV